MAAETQAKALAGEGVTRRERSELTAEAGVQHGASGSAAMFAITQRELASLFFSPIAYVVGFVFLLLTGYSFVTATLLPGNEATMRPLFEWMASILVFAIPILTMRAIADEFASGSIESLMTAPVTDAAVIIGKFLGAVVFNAVLLAATGLHLILMMAYSEPVFQVVLVGYLGMILLGALFIAVGILASACTRHQLVAAIIAIAILAVFTFLADYLAEYAGAQWQRELFSYVNIMGHFTDFTRGILDTGSVIYFVSLTFFFLFLATKVLESKRWR